MVGWYLSKEGFKFSLWEEAWKVVVDAEDALHLGLDVSSFIADRRYPFFVLKIFPHSVKESKSIFSICDCVLPVSTFSACWCCAFVATAVLEAVVCTLAAAKLLFPLVWPKWLFDGKICSSLLEFILSMCLGSLYCCFLSFGQSRLFDCKICSSWLQFILSMLYFG